MLTSFHRFESATQQRLRFAVRANLPRDRIVFRATQTYVQGPPKQKWCDRQNQIFYVTYLHKKMLIFLFYVLSLIRNRGSDCVVIYIYIYIEIIENALRKP
jgi:hypothetical protein